MLDYTSVIACLILITNLAGYVEAGGVCQYSGFGNYYYYCYGYCYGYYCDYYYWDWDYTTGYVGTLTIGAFVGVIIGSLIFLGILITIVVVICASCTKTAGTRGRVVHPQTTGMSVISGGQNTQYSYPPVYPTAPPPYPGTSMANYNTAQYPPAYSTSYGVNAPPQPPSYASMMNNQDPGSSSK